jgi:hypothetical protein
MMDKIKVILNDLKQEIEEVFANFNRPGSTLNLQEESDSSTVKSYSDKE